MSQCLQLFVTFAQNFELWACPRYYVKYNVFFTFTSAESRDVCPVYTTNLPLFSVLAYGKNLLCFTRTNTGTGLILQPAEMMSV